MRSENMAKIALNAALLPNRQNVKSLIGIVVAENNHGNRFTILLKADDVILRILPNAFEKRQM